MLYVPTYWHVSDNFGDALTPWLVQHLSGLPARFVDPWAGDEVPYVITGSVMGWRMKKGIIWGAGCANEADLDPHLFSPPSPEFVIVMTRGPLSARWVREAGHAPVAFGDPGFVVPKFYQPKMVEPRRVGVICSWVDFDVAKERCEAPVLSTMGSVEPIIDQIASWDVVVSSSLHGLVIGIAYGKPVVWAKFSDLMVGNDFKFLDLFASIKVMRPRRLDVTCPISEAELIGSASVYDPLDAETLLACCPLPRYDVRAPTSAATRAGGMPCPDA